MADIKVCTIDEELKKTLRKFRFRKEKNCAAVIMKVNIKDMVVVVEEEMEDCTIEEVAAELPEFSPRWVAYSYCQEHSDGRVSFPLMLISYSPSGVKPEHNMIYAGTRPLVQQTLDITKLFEIRDVEDMTEEWLKSKLGFFN